MHYKKIFVAVTTIGILASTAALADDTNTVKTDRAQMVQDRQEARQEIKTQNVCDRIANFSDNLNQKASGQENQIKTHQRERMTNWESKTEMADQKLAQVRSQWEANRQEQFKKLEESATTDAQKKAVADFETTTEKAIATRESAVDVAIETFRTGVKNAIQTRQGQVDDIASSSASARKSALDKVKSDCDAGADAATVRATFQAAMKNARTQMQSDKQNVDKVGETVKVLVQTRQTAMKSALDTFKATMEKARTSLKKAFPDQTADTSSTSTSDTAQTEQ